MQILQAVIAVLLPAVATYLALQVAKLSARVDALPGIWKQIVTVFVAFGAAKAAAFFGVSLPGTLGGFDSQVVQAFLAAVASWLLHGKVAPAA